MNAPLDQSILDLLRQSAVGPMLDRPVNDVLRDMGLPALPEIPGLPPLPDLPPLPVIDLSLLAKPLTDLASSFGTGQLPSGQQSVAPSEQQAAGQPAQPVVDPAQMMTQVSTVLQTAMTLGSSALQIAMSLWQGMGASAAAEKGGEAATDGAAVATQSAQTSAGVGAAAGAVFTGATMMTAIIAKFMTSLAASAPFLATPGGQMFLVALTTETLAEATAVVAKTRGELTVHSAAMTETGTKVPVTNAPKGVDPMQAVSQIMQILGPLTQLTTTGMQSLTAVNTALNPPKSITDPEKEKQDKEAKEGLGAGGSAGVGGAATGGGAGGVGAINQTRQLAAWTGARATGSFGPAGASVPSAESAGNTSTTAMRGGSTSPGGMMPMAGAAGAAGMSRPGGESSTDGLRGQLVTEQHGNEVVGDIEGASLPVVGAAERVSEPLDSEPPDKALTL
ncbi:hypothetical protein [Nocardia sp. NBC_00403]|uniref:hypothetical protein n=1 Tax=Nocardia sp. NBC_00403 TaxID=2975990 RepID=UPI002E1A1636